MRRNVIGAAMGVVAAGAVLTACSGGGASSAAADTASSGGDAGSAAQTVEVTATEYEFGLSTTHFSPGTYTFVMKDDGHATHAITIDGPGVDDKSSDTSGPGGTASLTVTLQSGSYVLYCPIANHRALGMQTNLTVG